MNPELQYYKKLVARLERTRDVTASLIEACRGSLAVIKPPTLILPKSPRGKNSEEDMVVLFSDCQAGTLVVGEELGNKGFDFTVDTFRYRVRLYLQSILSILERQRLAHPVEKCWVWLGGDLIENTQTFKPQQIFVETDVLNQFFIVLYEVAEFLSRLSAHFPKVEVVCIPGNHGRVHSPKENTDFVNWEYVLYRFLQETLRENNRIAWDIPVSWYRVREVQGTRVLFIHGEDVRKWLTFPWYGAKRFYDSYFQMMSKLGQPFNVLVMGHFHEPMSWVLTNGEIIANGSFVGYTRYTMKRLGGEGRVPSQWVFFVHPKIGVSARYLVRLDRDDPALRKSLPPINKRVPQGG